MKNLSDHGYNIDVAKTEPLIEKAVAIKLNRNSILILRVPDKLLEATSTESTERYIKYVEQRMRDAFGFEVPVIVMSKEMDVVVADASY